MNTKFKKTIFVNVLCISVVIVCFEIYLRHTMPDMSPMGRLIQRSSDSVLGYELKPNTVEVFEGFMVKIPPSRVEISKQGLRDRVYRLKKDDGVVRLTMLGDSFVFGWGLELSQSIPKKLEQMLNQNVANKYEVMNGGVFSYNLIQEIKFLEKKLLKYNPDLIIFLITGNDADTRTELIGNKLSTFFFSKCYLYRHIKILIEKKKAKQDIVNTTKSFEQLKTMIHDPHKLLIVIKNYTPWMSDLVEICHAHDIQVLDFSKTFKMNKDHILLDPHDQHLNAFGAELLAKEIFNFIDPQEMF